MIEVRLTPAEILLGAQAGVMRQVQNLKNGNAPAYGAGALNDWQLHIEGALGEMALAKHLRLYWSGKGKLRAADVGEIDVRASSGHNNRLILHEADPDDRVFWLLTGTNGDYRIHGWILGSDGKQQKFWADPSKKERWAYFIPQDKLHKPVDYLEPVDNLLAVGRRRKS